MKYFSFRKALSTVASIALVSFGFCASTQAQQHTFRINHVPDAVRTGQASATGDLEAEQSLRLEISLPLRNEDTLDTLLQQIYDPSSPNFHHYLTAQQFTDSFAPSQQDYDAVVAWAQAKGLQVTGTTPNRRLVEVEGQAGVINRAFHVLLKSYRDNRNARSFHAPDREPTVDLQVQLLAVSGLDNAVPLHSHYKKGDRLVQNSNTFTESASVVEHIVGSGPGNTYLPSDMRAAYYGSGPLDGAGQTVAIFSFDDYLASDLNVYYSRTGMTSNVPVTNVYVNGYSTPCFGFNSNGTINYNVCDDGEQILDIVNVIGMAPGLSGVLFYEGNSATAILNKIALDNKASVISSSWGGGDFGAASVPAFKEFQAQGQTYLNATGDSGQFNGSTYDPPSVDPNIMQVGGTDLVTTGAAGPWASETGWADSGGGFMSSTPIPSYQLLTGVITATNKASTTYRNTADVAAEANFDNTTVINGKFSSGYGGTSFAAPRWAGLIALANQQSAANGNGRLGFLNPSIYSIGTGSNYAADFHDITSGLNKPLAGTGTGFNAVAGYDLVTGWGSPIGAALIADLTGTTTATGDYSLSASPSSTSIVRGATATSTITVTGINSFSNSVALAASGLPTGVTASFSPASTTGTSTLTLAASSTATIGLTTVTITGTSGSLTHTTTIALTVTATPDYSLSASATSVSVLQSNSGSSTISVSGVNSFAGTVDLSASGLPTGVTASFSPSSTKGTSALTLIASNTATVGVATITITGTSGALTHTTTISLTILPAPDYSLSALPSSVSVLQGATSSSTIAITGSNNFSGSVSLSASGLPAGVTASFSPVSTTGSSTLTLTAANNATVGSATITITGTSGALSHSVVLPITIIAQLLGNPGFESGMSSAPWTTNAGVICSSSTCPGEVANTGAWFAKFDGYTVNHTDMLVQQVTIPATATTATLSYYLHIDTAETTKTVPYDTFRVQILTTGGSLLEMPASYSNLNAAPGYVLQTFDMSPYIGKTVQIRFIAQQGNNLATTFVVDDVALSLNNPNASPTPNYTLSTSSGNLALAQGTTGSSSVAVANLNGFNGLVTLSTFGLPSGVTASFSPASTTGDNTLTLTISPTAKTGSSTITITGTSGILAHTVTIPLTVTSTSAGDYSLAASPVSVVQGAAGISTIAITDISGFTGLVGLTASGLPSGVTASFSPASTTSTSTLTLTASSTASVGLTTVTVTGTSGSLTHTATVALHVIASSDYSLSASPNNLSVVQGNTRTSTITVTSLDNFNGSVSLVASGLPSGVTAIFSPASTTSTSTLTLTTSHTAALGLATVTITGTSGSLIHTTTVALTITPAPDYSLSVSAGSVVQGTSGTSTVTITALNDFNGAVNLVASGLPSGVTASFSPATTTTSSTVTLMAAGSAPIGQASITITGTSGSLIHTATVGLTVMAAQNYLLSASPSTLNILQGLGGASMISVGGINNFSGSVSLSASGLPAGVTASFSPVSTTGSSTLTLTAANNATVGSATITITGTSGALSHSVVLPITIIAQLLGNPGFESGMSSAPWTTNAGVICSSSTCPGEVANTGAWFAKFDGYTVSHTDMLVQQVTIPATATTATLSYYLHIDTAETTKTVPYDTFRVQILTTGGSLLEMPASYSNLNAAPGYVLQTFDMSPYIGKTVQIRFIAQQGNNLATTFVVDDVALSLNNPNASPTPNYTLSTSSGNLALAQGTTGSSSVAVANLNGFNGLVTLSTFGLPSGVTASFSPASTTGDNTLTLTISPTAKTGSSTITITGTSGILAHTVTIPLTVAAAPH